MNWRGLLAALLLCSCLGAQELVLGAEDAAGAWGRPDGSGCGNDIVKAAYMAVGIHVRLKILPYARAKSEVLDGRLAGCFAMSVSPELNRMVLFSQWPLYAPMAVFVRQKGRHAGIRTLNQLPREVKVGTVLDYEYPEAILQLPERGVRLVPNQTETANLEMLSVGRLDFTVIQVDALKSLNALLHQAKVQNNLTVAFSTRRTGSFVGFSRAHPQGPWAKAMYDRGFARIQANGTLAAILASWKSKPQ